jgi:hypothetical protein
MSDKNLYATAKAWGIKDVKPKGAKKMKKGEKTVYWLKGYQDMGYAIQPPMPSLAVARKNMRAYQKAFGSSYLFKIEKSKRTRE